MKFIKKIIIILILVLILISGIFISRGYKMYKTAVERTPIDVMVKNIQENEKFISFEEMPKDYINAVIAVEDRRFYKHNGMDVISIGRAIFTDIKNLKLVEGGSTITQQVAKNNLLTQEKKDRKENRRNFCKF